MACNCIGGNPCPCQRGAGLNYPWLNFYPAHSLPKTGWLCSKCGASNCPDTAQCPSCSANHITDLNWAGCSLECANNGGCMHPDACKHHSADSWLLSSKPLDAKKLEAQVLGIEVRAKLRQLAEAVYVGDDSKPVLELAREVLKDHGWPVPQKPE